jgi:hypothetical protein
VLGRAAPMIGCVCQLTRKPASIALCSASGTPPLSTSSATTATARPSPFYFPPVRITLPALRGRPLTALGPPKRPIPITYILHNPPVCCLSASTLIFFSPGDGSRHDKSLLISQRRPPSKRPRRAPNGRCTFFRKATIRRSDRNASKNRLHAR